MENNIEELLGSQRRVTKKLCDPKTLRGVFRKFHQKGRSFHVHNLYVNVQLKMSQLEEIGQLIMEYNQKTMEP